ncbi:hypothetical protein [Antricoccus suffuscus]|nr:hypothetical protein [Antricoccus suffuscus]
MSISIECVDPTVRMAGAAKSLLAHEPGMDSMSLEMIEDFSAATIGAPST